MSYFQLQTNAEVDLQLLTNAENDLQLLTDAEDDLQLLTNAENKTHRFEQTRIRFLTWLKKINAKDFCRQDDKQRSKKRKLWIWLQL